MNFWLYVTKMVDFTCAKPCRIFIELVVEFEFDGLHNILMMNSPLIFMITQVKTFLMTSNFFKKLLYLFIFFRIWLYIDQYNIKKNSKGTMETSWKRKIKNRKYIETIDWCWKRVRKTLSNWRTSWWLYVLFYINYELL